MKKVLVLGAGLVARPLVNYLVNTGFDVTVASRTVEKAERIVESSGGGKAVRFDISGDKGLEDLIGENDAAVSLLPYTWHTKVARACIKKGKHLITTSYVSDDMRSLHASAREAGVILLNETGLDPGIDHMEAQRIIDMVHEKGGAVDEFISYCGGLPAIEDNTNPWGYKFSWSPRGVVLASKNDARFKRDGRVLNIPGKELFANYEMIDVPEIGKYEGYPNRDSVPYGDIYGIPRALTILRGTLRNRGWCDTWKGLHDIGMLEERPTDSNTFLELMNELAPGEGDIEGRAKDLIDTRNDDLVIENWKWLGLFSDEVLTRKDSVMDSFSDLLEKKLVYEEGEKDMIILQHTFNVTLNAEKKTIRSTMVVVGDPGGDSAMSRTVGLPAAIGTEMVLNGELEGSSGVMIPTSKNIYLSALEKLKKMGIEFKEE